VREEKALQANPSLDSHSIVLDLGTLTAVRAEVTRLAADWRQAWRLNGPGCTSPDPRLERAKELDCLAAWLETAIEKSTSGFDADLEQRFEVTPAGLAALERAVA
jgi:hypothetical protein